jgi:catechol-2,3-dioxygenase
MVEFYTTFLGGTVSAHENISFVRYDKEHHRLGIVRMKNVTGKSDPKTAGLEHVGFAYDSLADLALAYKQRKAKGFVPAWCVNHGPATSMYYTDPDGNHVECQVDNFESADDALEFMKGPEFEQNPIGVDFDPEAFVSKVESGFDEKVLKKRPASGLRADMPDTYVKF